MADRLEDLLRACTVRVIGRPECRAPGSSWRREGPDVRARDRDSAALSGALGTRRPAGRRGSR